MKKLLCVLVLQIVCSLIWAQRNPIGKWRGIFITADSTQIPFEFDVVKNKTTSSIYFLNGAERFYGGAVTLDGDSLRAEFQQFNNELVLGFTSDTSLTGYLHKNNNYRNIIHITASKHRGYRFLPSEKNSLAAVSLQSTYRTFFKGASGRVDTAVALFKQRGNHITLTFLRTTGDSRYIDGIVQGNNFIASSFIGSSPTLYKGTVLTNGNIEGFQIGLGGKIGFTATPDKKARLKDEYSLTKVKYPDQIFDFSFKNADGKTISLKDKRYIDKPIIVTIGGTWCPNCIDEAIFLTTIYGEIKKKGVEIITIQYETDTTFSSTQQSLRRFQKRFGFGYEQVVGGLADKKAVVGSLPQLDTFIAFPTTLFLNKAHQVKKIHTGFSGPATGVFHQKFISQFKKEVSSLMIEE